MASRHELVQEMSLLQSAEADLTTYYRMADIVTDQTITCSISLNGVWEEAKWATLYVVSELGLEPGSYYMQLVSGLIARERIGQIEKQLAA